MQVRLKLILLLFLAPSISECCVCWVLRFWVGFFFFLRSVTLFHLQLKKSSICRIAIVMCWVTHTGWDSVVVRVGQKPNRAYPGDFTVLVSV